MQCRHLLRTRLNRRLRPALYQQLKELDVMQRRLVDRIVLIVALVDLIGPLRDEVFDAVPGAALARDVEEGPFLLPGEPVVFALLGKELENIDLK